MQKDLKYWKQNAEEDYVLVPISVLKYISKLEQEVERLSNPLTLKYILKELVRINQIDLASGWFDEWDGRVSYTGLKRLLYGLWHEGKNEAGSLMCFCDKAELEYKILMQIIHLFNIPQPVIRF